MAQVTGTQGYELAVEAFARASFELEFERINADFLAYLPQPPARVLDAGCGVVKTRRH